MVESQFSKLIVAGSSPVLRSEWRDVRVAYGAALEMLCTFTGTQGSNPCLSAGVSSKGKTADFESAHRGSTPCTPTKLNFGPVV